MCLSSVESTNKGLSRKVLNGYKVFQVYWVFREGKQRGPLRFQYQRLKTSNTIKYDKWMLSRSSLIFSENHNSYYTGFHIYKNRRDAEKVVVPYADTYLEVVKVKYKGILAKGNENNKEVVVAKYMWVSSKWKEQ